MLKLKAPVCWWLLMIVDDCWWLKYYSLKLIYCKNNVFINRFDDVFAEAFMDGMLMGCWELLRVIEKFNNYDYLILWLFNIKIKWQNCVGV